MGGDNVSTMAWLFEEAEDKWRDNDSTMAWLFEDAELALTIMGQVSMLEGWLGPHWGCGTLYGEGWCILGLRFRLDGFYGTQSGSLH